MHVLLIFEYRWISSDGQNSTIAVYCVPPYRPTLTDVTLHLKSMIPFSLTKWGILLIYLMLMVLRLTNSDWCIPYSMGNLLLFSWWSHAFLQVGLWSAHLYSTATVMNADCKHICELCVYSKVSESTKRQTSLRTNGARWTLICECVTAHDKELSASCVFCILDICFLLP